MEMNKKVLHIISFILASAAIIAFAVYLNFLTPLFADDFSYSVSFATKAPIKSFSELIGSQYLHYFTTNGRSVVHTLAQILLAIGKPALNVINGFAFYTLILLICYHAAGELKKIRAWQLVAVFAALWFFTPHFGGSYLWVMGGANYMYSPQIILLFLIPYNRFLRGRTKEQKSKGAAALISVSMFLFGIVAGWTNENTSLALLAMVVLTDVYALIAKKKPRAWMWCGLAGNLVGAALLFFSPAQAKRLGAAGGFGSLSDWLWRFLSISKRALLYFAVPLALVLISLVILIVRRKKQPISDIPFVVIFSAGAFVSLYSMVGSPEFPATVWSGILAFFLIPALFLVSGTRLFEGLLPALVCSLALVCAVTIHFSFVAPELIRINGEYAAREELIAKAKESGDALEVDLISTESKYSPYSVFREMEYDEKVWPNNAIANYYGIKSIKLKK